MIRVLLVLLIVSDCRSLPTPGCPGGSAWHDPPYDGKCCPIMHCSPGGIPIPCLEKCTLCDDGTFMANSHTSLDGVYRCNVHSDCTGDTEVGVKGNTIHDNVCRCKNGLLDVATGCTCESGKYLKSGICVACPFGTFKPGNGIECKNCTNCGAKNQETESECDAIHDSVCKNKNPDPIEEDNMNVNLSTQPEPKADQNEEKDTTSVPTWVKFFVPVMIVFIIIIVGIILWRIRCRPCKDQQELLTNNIDKTLEDDTTDCNGASKQNGDAKPNSNGISKKHNKTNGNELSSLNPTQVQDSSLNTLLLDQQQDGNDAIGQFSNGGISIDSPTSPSGPPTFSNGSPTLPSGPSTLSNGSPTLPSGPSTLSNGSPTSPSSPATLSNGSPTSPSGPPTLPSDPPTLPSDPPSLPSDPPPTSHGSDVRETRILRDSNPTDSQGNQAKNGNPLSEALSSLCAENCFNGDDLVDGKSSVAGASTLPKASLCGDPNARESPQVGERDGIQKEIKKPQLQDTNSTPLSTGGYDSTDNGNGLPPESGLAEMVQKHRDKLNKRIKFVSNMHLGPTFWSCFRQYKVLDHDREERIKKLGITEGDQVCLILDLILRKDGEDFEHAFLTLIRALVLSHQKAIADFLDVNLANSIDVEEETSFPSIEDHNGGMSNGNLTPERTSAVSSASAPSGRDTIDFGVRLRDVDRHYPEQQQHRETNIKEIAKDIDSEGEDLDLKSTTEQERVGLLKTDSQLKNNSSRPSNIDRRSPDQSDDDIRLDEFRS